jgi:hypothetical protein
LGIKDKMRLKMKLSLGIKLNLKTIYENKNKIEIGNKTDS